MEFRDHRIILPRTGHKSVLTAASRASNLAPVSTDLRLQRGTASEQLAAEYLLAQGLVVLARNVRCRAGELDLVCLDGGVLAIVEVRQRIRIDFGGALASVTWRKQRKISSASLLERIATTGSFESRRSRSCTTAKA